MVQQLKLIVQGHVAIRIKSDLGTSTYNFPGGSVVKNPPTNAGDAGSNSGWGRSPGGETHTSLQYSYLENPMDRGACQATVQGVTQSWTQFSD